MSNAQEVVHDAIRTLLAYKRADTAFTSATVIEEILESLDVAELSAILEDSLGRDPYSEDVVPRTVGDLIAWYRG